LRYNSNGLELSEKLFELWNHFKEVRFNISIDSVAERNEYIRYPSKWNDMLNSLQRLDDTPDNIIFNIACAVQLLNITTMHELAHWKLSQNYKNAIVVNAQLRNYLGSNANVERYKNQLTAIAVAPNAKGKLPKKSDVKAAIKAWIGYTYPPGPAGIPRVVENMVTGETRVVMPPNRSKVPSPRLLTPPAKRISPLKVAKREPAYKRPRKPKNLGPAVGPIKKPPPGGNNNNNNSQSRSGSVNLNKLMR
jgi:hypothetical protein